MGVTIDTSEVRALAADMRAVDSRLVRHVIHVVEKGAVNVKADMRAAANNSKHFKIARSITYDLSYPDGAVEAEVGPTLGGAGSLAGIAYFGGANGGGGTIEDPQGAADREAPRFEQALSEVAAWAVLG